MQATNLSILHPFVQKSIAEHGIKGEAMLCDESLADTAAFCEHYKFSPEQTVNAIIVAGKSTPVKYACCLVLANAKLDVNKTVCQLLEVKRCSFAGAEQTLNLTGMQIGGVTPFGLPEETPIYIDEAIMVNDKIVTGGGNRTSKLLVEPKELLKLPQARVVGGLGLPR
jgi:prolyl-tRNA editing enzyme YbaK/EbsC (Cys-tRNA(Pro) deacylase)